MDIKKFVKDFGPPILYNVVMLGGMYCVWPDFKEFADTTLNNLFGKETQGIEFVVDQNVRGGAELEMFIQVNDSTRAYISIDDVPVDVYLDSLDR